MSSQNPAQVPQIQFIYLIQYNTNNDILPNTLSQAHTNLHTSYINEVKHKSRITWVSSATPAVWMSGCLAGFQLSNKFEKFFFCFPSEMTVGRGEAMHSMRYRLLWLLPLCCFPPELRTANWLPAIAEHSISFTKFALLICLSLFCWWNK